MSLQRRGIGRERAEIPAELMLPDGTRCGPWKEWIRANGWGFVEFLQESRRRREWYGVRQEEEQT
jgi:hypothetical protein